MALPDVTLDIQDGGLGIVSESTENVVLKMGTASQGPTNEVLSFTRVKDVIATFGAGPLVEAAALSLVTAGGPVLCLRIPSTTAGAAGAVTPGASNTGTATMAVAGAAEDAYDVEVTITRDGDSLAANTSAFTYTLDGGKTVSPEIAMPTSGSYVLPSTGLTLTFTDGLVPSFKAGDTFSFTTTPPGYALADLQTAVDDALADPREWSALHVVGAAADAASAAAMAAAMDTKMTAAEQAYRFAFAIIELPVDTDASLLAAFLNTTSKRVMACADVCTEVSPTDGLQESRSSAWPVAARVAKVPIHEDLGRVATGPITGVSAISRDEQATPGLDAKFATLRTIIGRSGFYVTSGRMLAPDGSDFTLVQNRRVMDRACQVARNALLTYLNDSLVLQDASGQHPGAVTETQARAIETDVNSQLASALTGHVSKAYVQVDRTHDVSSDNTLPVTVRVQPLGYARFITTDIGFVNAALTATA